MSHHVILTYISVQLSLRFIIVIHQYSFVIQVAYKNHSLHPCKHATIFVA